MVDCWQLTEDQENTVNGKPSTVNKKVDNKLIVKKW